MIKIENLHKNYHNGKGEVVNALIDITYSFPNNGLFFIAGKSGSGKTTLLDIIGGLDRPDLGSVFYNEINIETFDSSHWEKIRQNDIGYIFQENNLLERLDILSNIMLLKKTENNSDLQTIERLMQDVGLDNISLNRKANELSAGQKQRISILRALNNSSKLILADEPTENLDIKTSRDIMNILHQISLNRLVIVVTHNLDLARELPSTIIFLEDGKIIREEESLGIIRNDSFLEVTKVNNDLKLENKEIVQAANILGFLQTKSQNLKDEFRIKLVRDLKDKPIPKSNFENYGIGLSTNKITRKSITRFSLKSLTFLNARYLISAFIILISLIFTLFLGIVSTYNENIPVKQYVNDYNINAVRLYEKVKYVDMFNEDRQVRIESGYELYNDISSISDSVYKVKERVQISKTPFTEFGYLYYVNYASYNNIKYQMIGSTPEGDNQVLISDYLYTVLYEDEDFTFPKTIYDYDGEKTIVGAIITGYENTSLYNENIRREVLEKNYSFIYTNSIPTDEVHLLARNKTLRNIISVTDLDLITSVDNGVIPTNNNEIVISSKLADEYSLTLGDYFSFTNIYDEKYLGVYKSEVNYYDYFDEDLKVVGIIDSLSNSVFINSDIYDLIFSEYIEYYYFDYYIAYLDNTDLITDISEKELKIHDSMVDMIYEVSNQINFIQSMLIPIILIASILLLFSCINAISSILHHKKVYIGVLRAQGLSKNNIQSIFLTQTITIFLFCTVLTIIGYFLSIQYLNEVFTKAMDTQIIVFKFQYLLVFIVLLITALSLIFLLKRSLNKILSNTIFNNLYK